MLFLSSCIIILVLFAPCSCKSPRYLVIGGLHGGLGSSRVALEDVAWLARVSNRRLVEPHLHAVRYVSHVAGEISHEVWIGYTQCSLPVSTFFTLDQWVSVANIQRAPNTWCAPNGTDDSVPLSFDASSLENRLQLLSSAGVQRQNLSIAYRSYMGGWWKKPGNCRNETWLQCDVECIPFSSVTLDPLGMARHLRLFEHTDVIWLTYWQRGWILRSRERDRELQWRFSPQFANHVRHENHLPERYIALHLRLRRLSLGEKIFYVNNTESCGVELAQKLRNVSRSTSLDFLYVLTDVATAEENNILRALRVELSTNNSTAARRLRMSSTPSKSHFTSAIDLIASAGMADEVLATDSSLFAFLDCKRALRLPCSRGALSSCCAQVPDEEQGHSAYDLHVSEVRGHSAASVNVANVPNCTKIGKAALHEMVNTDVLQARSELNSVFRVDASAKSTFDSEVSLLKFVRTYASMARVRIWCQKSCGHLQFTAGARSQQDSSAVQIAVLWSSPSVLARFVLRVRLLIEYGSGYLTGSALSRKVASSGDTGLQRGRGRLHNVAVVSMNHSAPEIRDGCLPHEECLHQKSSCCGKFLVSRFIVLAEDADVSQGTVDQFVGAVARGVAPPILRITPQQLQNSTLSTVSSMLEFLGFTPTMPHCIACGVILTSRSGRAAAF